jgi:hypothetical protein
MTEAVHYRESQRLGGGGRALLLLVAGAMLVGALAPIAVNLLRRGQTGGTEHDQSVAGLAVAGSIVLASTILPLLLLTLTLNVEVSADEVLIRLDARTPLALMRPRRILRDEIVDAAVGSELPFGFGASRRWRRESYRVSGGAGVELTLRSGKTVFIGSSRPRELLAAVRAPRRS